MKKPTAAQLAARKKFAEMARSGALAKKRKAAVKKTVRAKNPVAKKKTVSKKISQLRHEGYPQKQAVAVALSEQRAGKVKRNPTDAAPYAVRWTSAVTGSNRISHHKTKASAIKEARDLYKEGAKNIDTFKYSKETGASFFDWETNTIKRNPIKKTMHMYTVHRCDANGNPVYHIAHFRNLKDAKEYANAYANAHGKMIAITKKAI